MTKVLSSRKYYQALLVVNLSILFLINTFAHALSCSFPQYFEQDGKIYYGLNFRDSGQNKVLKGVKPANFTATYDLGKTRKSVYYKGEIIQGADVNSFQLYNREVYGHDREGYGYDKNFFYAGTQKVHHEGDLANLEILDSAFSKDNEHIYYFGQKVKELDVKTFKILKWDAPYKPHKTWGWGCSNDPSFIAKVRGTKRSYNLKDLNKLYKDHWEIYEN